MLLVPPPARAPADKKAPPTAEAAPLLPPTCRLARTRGVLAGTPTAKRPVEAPFRRVAPYVTPRPAPAVVRTRLQPRRKPIAVLQRNIDSYTKTAVVV